MTETQKKELELLVEQKLLEFLGDPDSGLELNAKFAAELRRRLKSKQRYVPMAAVAKKYGLRSVER